MKELCQLDNMRQYTNSTYWDFNHITPLFLFPAAADALFAAATAAAASAATAAASLAASFVAGAADDSASAAASAPTECLNVMVTGLYNFAKFS